MQLATSGAEPGVKQTSVASGLSAGTSVPLVPLGANRVWRSAISPHAQRKVRLLHRHTSLRLCSGMSAPLGLVTRSLGNWSVNTDAQVRPCAARTSTLCAGYFQR
jgi:hypothetical protein